MALVVCLAAPASVSAQRYRFKYYSHGQGLKDTDVHSLAQDRAGFIWVGTATGLFRYDGARFTGFLQGDTGTNVVDGLAETPDGTLWIGTQNGLARLRGDHVEFVDPPGKIVRQLDVGQDRRTRINHVDHSKAALTCIDIAVAINCL